MCQSHHARKLLSELSDMKRQIDEIGYVEATTSAIWAYLNCEERNHILKWVFEIDVED